MARDSGFERDFGYLMPFFDRVASATEGLSPEARAELQRLLAGEKEKWQRIREVLGGVAAAPAPNPTSAGAAKPAAPAARPVVPSTFTVGSLRRG